MKTLKTEHITLNIEGWGKHDVDTIMGYLNQTVTVFKETIQPRYFNKKPVLIENYTDKAFSEEHPKMYKVTPENIIYLNINEASEPEIQFIKQFSHEYTHHLLDCDFYNTYDQFGWFEEMLCEVAELFVLKAISDNVNPSDAQPLKLFIEECMTNKTFKLDQPLYQWIKEKEDFLSLDRYFREHNQTIAVQLAPLFFESPQLWNAMMLINKIQVTETMTFETFFEAWEAIIEQPDRAFLEFKAMLLGTA